MKPFHIRLAAGMTILAILFSSCTGKTSVPPHHLPWTLDSLVALELPDTSDPASDIIALYGRRSGNDLEIRMDFLGSPVFEEYDLYLVFDTRPGGSSTMPGDMQPGLEWELLLFIPGRGAPHAVLADGQPAAVRPRTIRNSVQDSITVRASLDTPGSNWKDFAVQAFITKTGSPSAEDSIGPVHFADEKTFQPGPLALVFTNALPSATPAQALRRWDGAHTGPFGQRHGLAVLLRAALRHNVPVAILDLSRPERLAALDAVGGLSLVRDLQKRGLLLMPDSAYGSTLFSNDGIQLSRQSLTQYGFSSSGFLSGNADPQAYQTYDAAFTHQADPTRIIQQGNTRFIPLPNENDSAGPEGISVSARSAILAAALSTSPNDLVILGGDLAASPWADSLTAGKAFEDLGGHPWIHLLDAVDLKAFPASSGEPDCTDPSFCLEEKSDPYLDALEKEKTTVPDNLFSQAAVKLLMALSDPTADPRLEELRRSYYGQAGLLLAASRWVDQKDEQNTCLNDLDGDGSPECILSTKNYIAVIDPLGGRLEFAAAQTHYRPAQLVGSRAQLVVGLGDPFEWIMEPGRARDPQDIPGGFADSPDAWLPYQVSTPEGKLVLSQPENKITKTYWLDDAGLHIDIESEQPVQTNIPLILLDSRAYQPGWYGRFSQIQEGSALAGLELKDGPSAYIKASDAELSINSFTQSRDALRSPEDPDLGYPPGHFIPFSMAIVEIQSTGNFSILLTAKKP